MFVLAELFLFCVLLGRIWIGITAQDATTVDPTCTAPWNITVTSELEVRWSGNDRNGDMGIHLKAIDPPDGVKCVSKLETQAQFSEYSLPLPPNKTPCKGTRYNVTVALICEGSKEEQFIEVFIPPDALTAVENVILVNSTDETMDIQWDAIRIHGRPNIFYTVQWHPSKNNRTLEEDNTDTDSYTIRELKPYTEYDVQIRAQSGQDIGPWSEVLANRTKAAVPAVPQNLTATSDSTSISLRWEEPAPFRGPILMYSVIWRNNSKSVVYKRDNTTDLSYNITNLIPLAPYYIRVSATTEAGRGNLSEIKFVRTKRSVPPENLRPTSVSSRSIEVSWDEPSLYAGRDLIVAYSIQWLNMDTNENRTDTTTVQLFRIDDLEPFTNYSIRVKCWTDNGHGYWSQYITVETKIGSPDPPKHLHQIAITSRSIEVAWDEPSYHGERALIVAYSIQWTNTDTNGNRTENTTERTYTVEKLDPFTNYSIRVRAWTDDGYGDWTPYITVQTEIGIPGPPENLRIAVTSRSVEVAWDEPSLYAGRRLIIAYQVHWSNLDTNEQVIKNTTELTYKIGGLKPFTNYSVRVQARTEDGVGNWTPVHTVKTEVGVPPPPKNVRKGKVTASSIEVLWDVPNEYTLLVTYHSVRWKKADSFYEQTENTTDLKYDLDTLDAFTNYSISVRSWTNDGAGNWSDPITVETSIGVPSAPTNVTFTNIQQTSMVISWEEPQPNRGPITSYTVQWGSVNLDTTLRNTTTDMKYILEDLNPYTLYWVQVSASSYAGPGTWSPRLEGRTAIGIPSVPRNLKEIEATNTSTKIQWEEPFPSNGPITVYTVRWTNLNNEVTMNGTTKSLSYVVKKLKPFTNHSFEVRATTKAGSSEWSDSLIIRTNVGVPSEPKGLRLRSSTNSTLDLVWEEPVPVVGIIEYYIVQWNNTITGQKKKIRTSNSFQTIKSLDPYTEYSVRVRAATSVGQGNWTDPKIFRTSSGVPGSPLNVHKVNTTDSIIHVQWEAPKTFQGPIISYNIRWMNTMTRQNWSNSTDSLEHIMENLDAYTLYEITVKAKTEAGFGPDSDAVVIRTAIGIPTVPQSLSMRNKTAWSIEIVWSTPSSLNGPLVNYEIQWGMLGTETSSNFTNETYFVVDGLDPYTKYSFKVSAATEVGYGPQTPPLIQRTDVAVPSEPLGLKLMSSTSTSLSVEWKEPQSPNGPILGYYIQWSKYSQTMKWANETKVSKFSIIDLDPYTNYSIQISAMTSAGTGDWTKPLVANTLIGVPKPAFFRSVEEESSRSISVEWDSPPPYPGPTNYSLEIWRRPGQCEDASRGDLLETVLEGKKGPAEWGIRKREMVEDLVPYSLYYVRVILETAAGRTESGNSPEVRTMAESPEAPARVQADCSKSSTEVEVRWSPPSRANGKIIEYVVKYGVEFSGWNERILSATSQCKEHKILLKGLRPEKNYKIYVQARTASISKAGKERYLSDRCVLPAGVPPMGDIENVNADGSGSNQLTFVWSRDVFSDAMGSLMNYAIIVGESEAVGNATRGRVAELLPQWANFSAGMTSFYQATPLDWNPFEKEKSDPLNCEELRTDDGVEIRILLKCIVGVRSQCSSEEQYCNGPLQPDTTYGLKIRAFTRGGYSETEPIYAKTGPAPGSSLVGGLVGGFIFLLLVSAFIAGTFILKRKGKLDELRLAVLARFRPPQVVLQPPPQHVVHLEPYPAAKLLTAENFAEHVRMMMSDSHLRFSQEFEALKRNSPKFPCLTAEMEENRSKNRWLNIFPYDHSRVKLLPLGDDPESDFINANYIPGASSLREYIACQGPLNSTVDEMWRMVWEQATTMIVMLTQCVERGKNKCEQYWPTPAGETAHYGDVQVRTLSESMLSSYIIRVFNLQLGSQKRMVKQLHFTHWPDFGCPESPEHLINFVRAVRDHLPRIRPGPIVVHCSAGVGRTGTFIAVDRLSQQLRHTDNIDIYGTVMELRHHRVNMVQTEDQYIYIHLCVKQLLEEINEPTENEYEEAIYSNVGLEKDTGF